MNTASVAELKARLSEYLAAVKRGEDVIVTDRGKPVAKLAPLPPAEARQAHWAELIRSGVMRPPIGKLPADFFSNMPKDPGSAVLEALLEERAEGR